MSTTTFIAKFEDFANPDIPYMYHCHMLTHEDGGMMGQFIVVDPSDVDDAEITDAVTFPNPAHDRIRLSGFEGSWSVVNTQGQILAQGQLTNSQDVIDTSVWPDGLYVLLPATGQATSFVVQH
jgi:bilirubin oxidase